MITTNFIKNQLEKLVDNGHLEAIQYLDIEVTENKNNVILDDSQFTEAIQFDKKEEPKAVISKLNNLYGVVDL